MDVDKFKYSSNSVGRYLGQISVKVSRWAGIVPARSSLGCWQAVGPARADFTRKVFPEVREYLQETDGKLQCSGSLVVISLFMVGRCESRTKPTVMIVSDDKAARQRAFSVIKDSGIMTRHEGFALSDSSKAAEFTMIEQLAGKGHGDPQSPTPPPPPPPYVRSNQASGTVRIQGDTSLGRQCLRGSHLSVSPQSSRDSPPMEATACEYIQYNGTYLLLTVEHFLRPEEHKTAHMPFPPVDAPDDEDCEILGFDDFSSDDGGFEEDALIDATSRGSQTPESIIVGSDDGSEVTVEHSMADFAINSSQRAMMPASGHCSPEPGTVARLGDVGFVQVSSTALDYAAIQLENTHWPRGEQGQMMIDLISYSSKVEKGPRDTTIVAHTSSAGPILGRLSGTPSYVQLPKSTTFQEVYTASLHQPLAPGDCGSSVRDLRTGKLFGHIIAGSQITGVALIMPAHTVLQDLFEQLTRQSHMDIETNLKMADYLGFRLEKVKNHGEDYFSRSTWQNVVRTPVDVSKSDIARFVRKFSCSHRDQRPVLEKIRSLSRVQKHQLDLTSKQVAQMAGAKGLTYDPVWLDEDTADSITIFYKQQTGEVERQRERQETHPSPSDRRRRSECRQPSIQTAAALEPRHPSLIRDPGDENPLVSEKFTDWPTRRPSNEEVFQFSADDEQRLEVEFLKRKGISFERSKELAEQLGCPIPRVRRWNRKRCAKQRETEQLENNGLFVHSEWKRQGRPDPGQCQDKISIPPPIPHHQEDSRRLVISIDFGTTYTGVAWARSTDPENIHVVSNWPGIEGPQAKVPSAISYSPDGKSNRWGYEVQHDVTALRWFKLLLSDPDVASVPSVDPDILTKVQRRIKELQKTPEEVVSDYLREVWTYALGVINPQINKTGVEDIKAALTVPAIWSPEATQRTRRAALRAGLPPDIEIVAEPEAAALETLRQMDMVDTAGLEVGDTFIICDAGGGTVDVISYQVLESSPLRVQEAVLGMGAIYNIASRTIAAATGHDISHGSLGVKTASQEAQPHFQVSSAGAWIETDNPMSQETDPHTSTAEMYDRVSKNIINLVESQVDMIRSSDKQARVKRIYLCGGFGSSQYLERCLERDLHLKGIRTYRPQHSWTAIARGACIQALESVAASDLAKDHRLFKQLGSRRIASRISRNSYGVSVPSSMNSRDLLGTHRIPQPWDPPEKGSSTVEPVQPRLSKEVQWLLHRGDRFANGQSFTFHTRPDLTAKMKLDSEQSTSLSYEIVYSASEASDPAEGTWKALGNISTSAYCPDAPILADRADLADEITSWQELALAFVIQVVGVTWECFVCAQCNDFYDGREHAGEGIDLGVAPTRVES